MESKGSVSVDSSGLIEKKEQLIAQLERAKDKGKKKIDAFFLFLRLEKSASDLNQFHCDHSPGDAVKAVVAWIAHCCGRWK